MPRALALLAPRARSSLASPSTLLPQAAASDVMSTPAYTDEPAYADPPQEIGEVSSPAGALLPRHLASTAYG